MTLAAGSTYWVSVCNTAGDSDGISVASTADDGNDTASLSGWAIGDNVYAYVAASSDWLDHDDSTLGAQRVARNMKIAVNGVVRPPVRTAAYTAGRGTDTLTFTYDVTEQDTAPEGISWRANPIRLNGGSITGAATTNDANLAYSQHLGLPGHRVGGTRVGLSVPEFREFDHPGGQAPRSVPEGAAGGTLVGSPVAAHEPDGDDLTYSVVATRDPDAAAHLAAFRRDFDLDATSGQVTVKPGAQLGFETRMSYKVVVQVTDGEDRFGADETVATIDDTVTLVITVDNVDEVGAVAVTGSPTVGLALTASLSDPDGAVMSVMWQWSRAATAAGTYSDITTGGTAATYTPVTADEDMYLKATATYTDPHGSAKTAESAPVGPVHEPTEPEFAESDYPSGQAARSVPESATAGTQVGAAVAAEDADGDVLVYSVSATSDADAAAHLAAFKRDFELNTATGQVTVKSAARLDYETRSTYKVVVQVTDGEDTDGTDENPAKIDDTVTLTVTVDNVDEAGAVTVTGTPNVGVALTATLSDPDGEASSVMWQWSRAATAAGTYTNISTGGTSATYTAVAADADMYLKATATYTDPQGPSKTAESVPVGPVHEPTEPEFAEFDYPSGQAARSVPENSAIGTQVGEAVAAEDADGDVLVYSVSATSDADAAAHLAAFKRDFELNTATGQVTVKSAAQVDYETRSTYKVVVQVTDGEDSLGADESPAQIDDSVTLTVTLDNVDEAGAVAVTGTPNVGVALTAMLSDPDGEVSSVMWQWSRAATATGTYTNISTGGTSATYTPVAADADMYLKATATYTDPHGSAKTADSAPFGPVTDHSAPEFAESDHPGGQAARSVPENSTAGTQVGAAVAAEDADGDVLVYSVSATSDADAAAHLAAFNRDFELNTATGQVTVKSAAQVDYETRSTYKVVVQVTDGEDTDGTDENPAKIDDTVTLTVTLDDIDEAGSVTIKGSPTIGVARTASLTEGDAVMSVMWQWSKAATAAGTYTNIATSTTATYTPVEADRNMYLKATATYTDPHGSAKTAESAPFGPVTEHSAPEFRESDYPGGQATRSVPENSAAGTHVGAAVTAYEHDGDEMVYVLDTGAVLGAFGRAFILDTSNGQVSVKEGAQLDYETRSSYTAEVWVSDGEDVSGVTTGDFDIDDTLKLTITLENVDEAGTATIEGSPTRGAALTASVTDIDGEVSSVTWQWSRAANAAGTYTNIATGGTSATYTPVAADAGMFLKATATYTDSQGPAKTATSNPVGPVSLHSAPEFGDSEYPGGQAARSVPENSATGTQVGAAVAAYEPDGDTLTYSVVATTDTDAADHLAAFNRDFELAAASGQVTVKSGAQLDYETRSTYKVVVRVTDGEDSSGAAENPAKIDDTVTLVVSVGNVDEAGTVTITGTPNVGVAITASLSDGDGGVSSVSWQWSRAATATGTYTDIATGGTSATYTPVDADQGRYLKATAGYTDPHGAAKTAASAPAGPVNKPSKPQFRMSEHPGGQAARSVREDAATATKVGAAVTAHEPDGDTLTYSVVATSDTDAADHLAAFNRDLELAASSGQVTVKSGAQLDYETRTTYKVAVRVTDGEDNFGADENPATIDDTVTLTVTVTNVDEAGTVSIAGSPTVGATLTASLTDIDGEASSVTWQWSRAATAAGVYSDITSGGTSATYTQVVADAGMYLKATAGYTDPQGPSKTAASTPVGPISARSVPQFRESDYPGGQAARSVREGAAAGTAVGAAVAAYEPDGDTLTYSVVATSDADGAAHLAAFNRDFELAASSGQVTIKSGAQLDHETRSTYKVVVRVTDGEDSSGTAETPARIDDTVTLVVTVDNIDETGAVAVTGTPTIGETLSASLSDLDGDVSSVTWQWSRASTAAGVYTDITTGGDSATYTVVAADAGMHLKATASYTDPLGSAKTAESNPVGPVPVPSKPQFRASEYPGGRAARAVSEHAAAATLVGSPVAAHEPDGDDLTYSVVATADTDGAEHLTAFNRDFELAASSGQVTIKSGAQLDHETRSTYKVTVQVTDGEDADGADEVTPTIDDTVTLTVTVVNRDDAGSVKVTGSPPQIGEELTASLTDDDGSVSSLKWQWSRAATETGTYTDITTGGTSATYTPLAEDEDMYLKVTAAYTDALRSGRTAESVPLGPVVDDTTPEFAAATATRSVPENSPGGTNVGDPVAANEPDGDDLTYSLVATNETGGASELLAFLLDFDFDTTTGQVTVKADAPLDHEIDPSYKVVVQVTDGEDSSGNPETGPPSIDDSVVLTINVTNVDEPGAVTVSGESLLGSTLTASLADPDGMPSSVSWQWSSATTENGAYTNIPTATTATYAPVTGDAGKWLKATAGYTDPQGAGKTAESDPLGPVVEFTTPEFAAATATRSVAENSPGGANLGAAVTASEPDGDALTYSVIATNDANGAAQLAAFERDFDFDTSTAQVSVKSGVTLDYEAGPISYKVTVQVTDGEDGSGNPESGTASIDDSLVLTVNVTNVDEAGTVTVAGTPGVGVTLRGQVTDPDGGVSVDSWQWSESSQPAGPFTDMAGETNRDYTVVLADQDKYLRVTAAYSDGHGSGKTGRGTTDTPVRQVTRTNIEPTFATVESPVSVSEAAGAATLVGVFLATDGDGDTVFCSMADDPSDSVDDLAAFRRDFSWDCASGRLTVRSGAQLDYETRQSYAVVLKVSDRQNLIDQPDTIDNDDEARLRVDVTNADEPGTVTIVGDAAVGLAIEAQLTDGDGTVSAVSWQWSSSATQTGPFSDISGADEALYVPAAADEGRWLRATATYSDPQGPNKTAAAAAATVTAAVADPPEDRVHWRQVSFTRDRDTAYYSLQGWNPPSVKIAEGGDAATVWVRLDRSQVQRPYTVPITVAHHDGASPDDYRIRPAAVSFQPGAAFASFTIEALTDGIDDDNEYLVLGLDIPDGLVAGHVTSVRVDIVDDAEDLPPARLSFETAALSAGEGDWADITVTLDAPPDESIPNWSVLARLTLSSTLPPGEGVSIARLTNSQVRFNAAKMSHTVRMQCGSDGIAGPDHQVTLRLTQVTAGSRSGGPSYPLELVTGAGIAHELVVNCADAHELAELWARIYAASGGPWYRPTESSAPATVVVSLSDRADREVVIPIEALHHNNLSSGDYTGVPDAVTFAPGEQTATFEVWAIDDNEDDNDEWLEIRFGALPAGVGVASGETWHSAAGAYWDRSRYALEIIDDDDTPVVATSGTTSATVSFTNTATTVTAGGVVTVTVELHRHRPFGGERVEQQVVVDLEYAYGGGATAADYRSGPGGTAALPATLVFEPGQATHKFRIVATTDNTTGDSPKTITVSFTDLPAGVTAYSGGDDHNTITITTSDD